MSTRERRQARADRLHEWAEKREAKAEAAETAARGLADRIPFGQPILVGHHSEGRARRDSERIRGGFDRAAENAATARDMNRRAEGIEAQLAGSIYSDDDDAIPRLQAKIAGLEATRDRIKAYNASCRNRKAAGDASLLDDRQRADLLRIAQSCSYQLGKFGQFPGYATTNLGATINAAKKRLAAISGATP